MTEELTVKAVMDAMKQVVDDRPVGFRYADRVREIDDTLPQGTNCLYEINGKPACLVGMVLHRLGILDEALNMVTDRGNESGAEILVDEMRNRWNIETGVGEVLMAAQNSQDTGNTWRWSYELATQVAPEDEEE